MLLEGLAAAVVGTADVADDWAGELLGEHEGVDHTESEAYFAAGRELRRLGTIPLQGILPRRLASELRSVDLPPD